MTTNKSSSIVGELLQDNDIPEWYQSVDYPIPFFDGKKLPIVFLDYEDENFFKDADVALDHFLQLDVNDREDVSSYIYKNCIDFLDAVDNVDDEGKFRNLESDSDIWQYVYPSRIILSRRDYNDKDIYVQVDCECEWEQEHGLQLIFRQGKKLTRVSQVDGHLTEADAYDKPDEEDELLSRF